MRHYTLVALVAALSALPFSLSAFSLSPSSWFGGDNVSAMGRTHDKSHDVTSNGVTRVQMQYLYKDDMLVTDVDLSQSVTTNVYTKDETDEMTNLLAGADAALSRRVADNWSSIVLLELADSNLAFSNRIALVRVDGVQSNLALTTSAVADLASKVPYSAPYSAYSSLCLEPPAVRVSTDDGVGFCVRGSDGRYYDSREIAGRGVTPAFSVSTLYGRSFTPEYLNSNVSFAVWESGFTLSADNIDRRLRDVCTVTGYPYVYGEAATVRDLVYDLLTVDYSLWRDSSGVVGYEGSFMDLSSLASVAARGTAYAMRAHESVAQLRYDTRFSDDNRAFVNGVRMVSPYVAVVTPTNDTRVAGKAADAMATGIALATRYTKAETDAKLEEKANRAASGHADEIAILDADGNPKASGIAKDKIMPSQGSLYMDNVDPDLQTYSFGIAGFYLFHMGMSFGILSTGNGGTKWYYGDYHMFGEDREIAVKGDISAASTAFSNEVNAVARDLIRNAVKGLDARSATVTDLVNALKAIGD